MVLSCHRDIRGYTVDTCVYMNMAEWRRHNGVVIEIYVGTLLIHVSTWIWQSESVIMVLP